MAASYQSERAAVILAGGDGTRLCALTREMFGEEIPKQFCRFWGGQTLLNIRADGPRCWSSPPAL